MEAHLEKGNIGGVLWSSPNNPSWICLTEGELKGLGKLFTKYDVIAIEDVAYFGMDFRHDYGQPGEAPYQPTIARYTDNYFVILSSSKIFSYAGQRVAITFISPQIAKRNSSNLKRWFNVENMGSAFAMGGMYCTTAGVCQSAQRGLAALFTEACDGKLNFLERVKEYARRAKAIRKIFCDNGFHLVYDNDLGEPISDGFYFTIGRKGMTSGQLLHSMIRFGMAGIPLSITGSKQEGLRICTSSTDSSQFDELERRVIAMSNYLDPNKN